MTNDWIKWHWTHEKPHPETLDSLVYVNCGYGFNDSFIDPEKVSYWHEDDYTRSSWFGGRITHYKLA